MQIHNRWVIGLFLALVLLASSANAQLWNPNPNASSLVGVVPVANGGDTCIHAESLPYAVVGDGTTNNFSGLSALIKYAQLNNLCVRLAPGNYAFAGTLPFAQVPGWGFVGSGRFMTYLTEQTDNIPVMNFGATVSGITPSQLHSIEVGNFNIGYKNTQPSTNTSANDMLFTVGPYESNFHDIFFATGYWGMESPTPGVGDNSPWGNNYDRLIFGGSLTGGFIDWSNTPGTETANLFGRLMGDGTNATQTLFNALQGTSSSIGQIEFLNAHTPLMSFSAGSVFHVGPIKLENGTYTGAGVNLINTTTNDTITFDSIMLYGNTMTINPSSGSVNVLNVGSGGSGGRINVGLLSGTVVTSGAGGSSYNFMLENGASAPVEIGQLVAVGTNLYGIDQGSSVASDNCKVDNADNDWISQNNGDASVVLALGSAATQFFQTAFTAARTIDLPAPNNGICNGTHYTVIFNGAINGTNTASITSASNTLLTIPTDKVKVTYTWRRNAATTYLGWQLTDYEYLPMSTPTFTEVGIGTTSPAADLHILGTATASAWGASGIALREDAATYTDNSSAAGATVTNNMVNAIAQPTIYASLGTAGQKVTYTNAATLYIAGAPALGTNTLATNLYALDVAAGNSYFGGTVYNSAGTLAYVTDTSYLTTSGSPFTYTVPAGSKYLRVRICGGGGGGGGGTVSATDGAGGGGAGYCSDNFLETAGLGTTSVTVTIGAAGSAGSATGPTAGGQGGETSFGTFLTAYGGGGGRAAGAAVGGGGSPGGPQGVGTTATSTVCPTPGTGLGLYTNANAAATATTVLLNWNTDPGCGGISTATTGGAGMLSGMNAAGGGAGGNNSTGNGGAGGTSMGCTGVGGGAGSASTGGSPSAPTNSYNLPGCGGGGGGGSVTGTAGTGGAGAVCGGGGGGGGSTSGAGTAKAGGAGGVGCAVIEAW